MKVTIDKWGAPLIAGSEEAPEAYIVDASASGVTYICYDNRANRIVRRITVANGVTTVEFSYGRWADRASLQYVPINGMLEVEA